MDFFEANEPTTAKGANCKGDRFEGEPILELFEAVYVCGGNANLVSRPPFACSLLWFVISLKFEHNLWVVLILPPSSSALPSLPFSSLSLWSCSVVGLFPLATSTICYSSSTPSFLASFQIHFFPILNLFFVAKNGQQ
jgi:hypothetical protein